ncbi:hypothetical protein F4803DRAFT_508560 [Xylaria telfairii]|nr:hypothetical protein F4803DRAFT_508560 [Xylaria telfairii]
MSTSLLVSILLCRIPSAFQPRSSTPNPVMEDNDIDEGLSYRCYPHSSICAFSVTRIPDVSLAARSENNFSQPFGSVLAGIQAIADPTEPPRREA